MLSIIRCILFLSCSLFIRFSPVSYVSSLCFSHFFVLISNILFLCLIDYIFPYLITIGSVLSIANHLSRHIDQSTRYLVRASFRIRNLLIILFHWSLHAFGIVSLTGLTSRESYLYFLLIPTPMLFYIATSKFTHPDALFLEPQFDI